MAATCWVVVLTQMSALALPAMAPVMMAAMMLPSTVPLVAARSSRPSVVVQALAVYLLFWSVAGIAAYQVATSLPAAGVPVAVIAVAAAALYGLTPLQRGCRDRCRALCFEPKPGARLGAEYALNCAGCNAGVMAALMVIGPMNPLWMLGATLIVFAYKRGSPAVRAPS